MTTPARIPIPIPDADSVTLWSRQMAEMQRLLLNQNPTQPAAPQSAQVEPDDEDDPWDNLPV